MRKTNKISLILSQTIPARISKTKGVIDERTITTKFTTESAAEITSKKLALWLQANLFKYMNLKKLQKDKDDNFRQNKDIDILVSVNGKEESMSMKFSLNPDRLMTMLETSPLLVAAVFAPTPGIGAITEKQVAQLYKADGSLVLAPAIKVKKELPAPINISPAAPDEKLSLQDVELTAQDIEALG